MNAELVNVLTGDYIDQGIPFLILAYEFLKPFKLPWSEIGEIFFHQVHHKTKSSG
jgi:hypothetical protein